MDLEKRWKELCALAAIEKDPERLSQLVTEIVRLIDLRQSRLNANHADQHRLKDEDGSGTDTR